jgi:hypothetical protein
MKEEPMTFKELYLDELSRQLADTTTDFYSAEDRQAWVNQAYREETEILQPTRKLGSLAVTAGVPAVALPADFLEFAGVEPTFLATGDDIPIVLERRSVAELNEQLPQWADATVTGEPQFYLYEPGMQATESLVLAPSPARAGTVKVFYQPSYADMHLDGDLPWGGLHPAHHRLLALAAAVLALGQDADPERLGAASSLRDEARGRFAHYLAKRAPQTNLRLPVSYSTRRWRRR